MKATDILFCETCQKQIILTHQCKTENGIEADEVFTIKETKDGFGNFEQVTIINQYKQEFIINPNQIEGWKK